jgi:3-deoxy-D-manno-octulosonic acid kinase
MQIIKIPESNSQLWFNPEIWPECSEDYFSPEHWQMQRAIVGRSHGRGETLFFSLGEQEFVLRHYRRGGMVGKLNDDRYLYLGRSFTRCWREFNLLMKLQEMELPAPIPVAAHMTRDGFGYRADLITVRIPHARDLSVVLGEQRLSQVVWHQIGEVIARFHVAGVFHADLNCHNIMMANGHVWLIDFDRGELRRPWHSWRVANLKRLRRSFIKERGRKPHFHWLDSDWLALEKGYQSQMIKSGYDPTLY